MSKKENDSNSPSYLPIIAGISSVVFLVLKLAGVYDFTWWEVSAPIWGYAICFLTFIVTYTVPTVILVLIGGRIGKTIGILSSAIANVVIWLVYIPATTVFVLYLLGYITL